MAKSHVPFNVNEIMGTSSIGLLINELSKPPSTDPNAISSPDTKGTEQTSIDKSESELVSSLELNGTKKAIPSHQKNNRNKGSNVDSNLPSSFSDLVSGSLNQPKFGKVTRNTLQVVLNDQESAFLKIVLRAEERVNNRRITASSLVNYLVSLLRTSYSEELIELFTKLEKMEKDEYKSFKTFFEI